MENERPKKRISIKKLLGRAVIIFILGMILYHVFRPNLIYLYYKDDLEKIALEFDETDIYCLIAYNSTPIRYFSGYKQIDSSEVSDDLQRDIENIFDDGVIRYIGNTCLIDGVLYWNQFYVRIDDDGKKFLVYCPDPYALPKYSDYGPISCRWIGGDWYYIVVRDKTRMKK